MQRSQFIALSLFATSWTLAQQTRDLEFVAKSTGNTHQARFHIPESPNSRSVLLIGGGAITDMHWTVPGVVDPGDGSEMGLTIDRKPTKDADTIAMALADAGFCVLQWSSVHRDDPLAAERPGYAQPISYTHSVELSAQALDLLRAQPEVDPARITLLGHSLGATRATQIAATQDPEHRPEAFILLAGAQLARVAGRQTDIANNAMSELSGIDVNDDTLVSPEELMAWQLAHSEHALAETPFDTIDRDADEQIRGWELGAAWCVARSKLGDTSWRDNAVRNGYNLPFPPDVLFNLEAPTLIIYGGLDPLAVNAPILEHAVHQSGIQSFTFSYHANLGHQLSRVEGDRIASIETRVVKELVDWLIGQALPPASRGAAHDTSDGR